MRLTSARHYWIPKLSAEQPDLLRAQRLHKKGLKLYLFACWFGLTVAPPPSCGEEQALLNVLGGAGSGYYATNQSVDVTADAQPGKTFVTWSGGRGYVKEVYAAKTTIQMPAGGLTITAVYRDAHSSGIADIDELRERIKSQPTSDENYASRRGVLVRWWRLLWRQGYDVSSFDAVAARLCLHEHQPAEGKPFVDQGFKVLEEIFCQDRRIKEIRGSVDDQVSTRTNWPVYMGSGTQDGYSPDRGPSQGKIAWRFPKHHAWYAKPVVEDGSVFVSSPGADVVGYRLDEITGEVQWKARQFGFNAYASAGSHSDPIVSEDRVIFRTGYGNQSTLVVEKETGRTLQTTPGKPDAGTESPGHVYAYGRGGRLIVADTSTATPIWSYRIEDEFAGNPVIVDENVFVVTKSGVLLYFHINSSVPVWKRNVQHQIRGTVSVFAKRLYIGTTERKLLALDRQSGRELWTFEAQEIENRSYQYFSGVAEENGKLYVGAASGFVYCLNAADGQLVWKYRVSDWVRSKPLLIDGTLYVATLDGKLVAIQDHGKCGREVWKTQLTRHGIVADIVGGPHGIFASGRDLILYCVSPKTGYLLWRHGIVDGAWVDDVFHMAGWAAGLMTTPTVYDDVVFVGGPDGFVNALDVDTGKELWRFETQGTTSAAPTIAADKVFIGQIRGREYWALDRRTGEPLWTKSNYPRVWVGAAYAGGKLFFGDMDGYMYGVDPENGNTLWKYFTAKDTAKENMPHTQRGHGFPPGVYSNPAVDDENVYVGSWAGYYFAFDQATGELRWRTKTSERLDGGLPDSAAPTLAGNYLYVQKLGSVIAALHKETGNIDWQWQAPAGFLQNGSLAAGRTMVFGSVVRNVVTIPYQATIVAFDRVEKGGAKRWEYPAGGGLTAPVLTNDKVITGSSADVFLSCLDPQDGSLLWRVYTGGEMLENVPAICGDMVFVHSKNGYIYAVK